MADVSVNATNPTTARGMRAVVFTTDQIGYGIFIDSTGNVVICNKTTDGGASWGVLRDFYIGTAITAFDVWYDKWTPGDMGTRIHLWVFDSTGDLVRWTALDTATDSLSAPKTVFAGASAVAGRGAFVSGTKTRSGYLYCAYDIDAGAERGFHRSTDGGATWSANLSTTFVEATLDTCKLYPASGTGDDNDCWALYYDASALALTLKLWDSSAVAQVESATIGVAHTDGATDLTGQTGFDAVVRHSDGHLIVAKQSTRDVAAGTHQVFDITSTSTITTKTAIAASTDDHYYPQVFIDQSTNAIYVAYNGKRDGSEVLDTTTKVYYTKSTDGGTTWSAGDTAYMEGTAGVVQQVWSSQSGLRFYVVWRVGTTLLGNKVNSVSTPAGPAAQAVTGTTIAAGSSVTAAHTVDNALRVVTGATLASAISLPAPHVVTPGAVTVTGPTIAAGSSVQSAHTVSTAAAAQAVTGTTLTSPTAAVNAGSVTTSTAVSGTTITTGAVVRAGTVTTTTFVTGATLTTGAVVRAGTVTTTTFTTGATITAGAVVRAGTVTTTTAVSGATLASTAVVFPGAIAMGSVTILGPTLAPGATVFAGTATLVGAAADVPFMWLM